MNWLRQLIMPALVAPPFQLAALSSVRTFRLAWYLPGLEPWLSYAALNVLGISLFGRPFAAYLIGKSLSRRKRAALLVAAGAGGGYAIAFILTAPLGLMHPLLPLLTGSLGILPGAVAAAIWVAINHDMLAMNKEPAIG